MYVGINLDTRKPLTAVNPVTLRIDKIPTDYRNRRPTRAKQADTNHDAPTTHEIDGRMEDWIFGAFE
jgi:hypothetical protein